MILYKIVYRCLIYVEKREKSKLENDKIMEQLCNGILRNQ